MGEVGGIAGIVTLTGRLPAAARERALSMQAALRHRGPDARGLYIEERAALVQTGAAPCRVSFGEETYVALYDGELYNPEELRLQLAREGSACESESDAEIFARGYAVWGPGCVEKAQGVYAVAVYQLRAGRLFLARDRMGDRPLFYALRQGTLLFASELPALLQSRLVEPVIGPQGVAEILLLGPGRMPGSGVYRGVSEVKPARRLMFTAEGLRTERYWKLMDRAHEEGPEMTLERTRFLTLDAISRQIARGEPASLFLSGGLDSSILCAVMAEAYRRAGAPLRTYSVAYEDDKAYFHAGKFEPGDDGPFIRRMAEESGAIHTEVLLGAQELAGALGDAVRARGLPGMADIDASMLPLCQKAREAGEAVLSGECADEVFGGYPWYIDPEVRLSNGFPWAQTTAFRLSLVRPERLHAFDAETFVRDRYLQTTVDTEARPGLSAQERRSREMTRLNLDWFMQTLLDRNDRMAMAYGLTVRKPFLDHRLAEYLYAVPWAIKRMGGREKGLLREAVRGLIPEEIRLRKKNPYPKTHHPAYLRLVSDRLWQVVQDEDAPLHEIVRPEAVKRLLAASGRAQPFYGQLMQKPQTIAYLLQVNEWMRMYGVRVA